MTEIWSKNGICVENRTYVSTLFFRRQGHIEVGMYLCGAQMKLKDVTWKNWERLYHIRYVHVWLCWCFTMRGHVQVCEGQGVCLPTGIGWCCYVSSSQMGSTWVYRTWRQEQMDYVAWFLSRLVWWCHDVRDLNAMCQLYEKGPMGGNPIMYIFWMNNNFY